jgi:hypothetical protein
MRSIHVATVRRYVCKRKAVSAVSDTAMVGRTSFEVDGVVGRLSIGRFCVGGDSSSSSGICDLNTSHVEVGASIKAEVLILGCVEAACALLLSACDVVLEGLLYSDGVIKSKGLHSRPSLSQLPHILSPHQLICRICSCSTYWFPFVAS